jgi:prephenate dehydrogenase
MRGASLHVHIIGAGLIGTSIGLKLKEANYSLSISDLDPKNEQMGMDLLQIDETVIPKNSDVVIIATPPNAVFPELQKAFLENSKAMFIDIAGIKSNLHVEVEKFPEIAKRFCSAHPMAGREVSGPGSARADIFDSRPWIVTPTSKTDQEVIDFVLDLGRILGSTPFTLGAQEHDAAVALVSHFPQILSSLLAGMLSEADIAALNLAGQGLRDLTRLADSDPKLWSILLTSNSDALVPKLDEAISKLNNLKSALISRDGESIEEFISQGRSGRARIPGKHGGGKRDYTYLPIVISDKPGQLALIFQECSSVGVNIEDLAIEHSPNQETGLITLALNDLDAHKLQKHLLAQGWLAHIPRK